VGSGSLGPEPTPKEFGDVGAGSSASLDATGGPLPSDAEAGASGAPAFDFHSLVDLSHPLSLGEVVEAVECVLNHPRATALPTMQVIKDILMCVGVMTRSSLWWSEGAPIPCPFLLVPASSVPVLQPPPTPSLACLQLPAPFPFFRCPTLSPVVM
jgi:hypothetical protein